MESVWDIVSYQFYKIYRVVFCFINEVFRFIEIYRKTSFNALIKEKSST